ncbi:putative phytanoyl-CoA dioxygenase [Colletotrichum fructicola Nara gc5]|uniref:Putative phytanoyl-CoA dioxygenase n=1 Tax=Colletotrichum fructicola (strain Nara gc5) TaxID=1213859 RepID=A0A7J6IF52_COLFN|nr:putative phytanoyl-CoA dioxygenase [Colletotrichum fructicola Nara gc5]
MLLNHLCRRGTPSFCKLRSTQAVIRAQPKRTIITWLEQDNWEDPKGPLGINRPSPKLAPLTPESPQWLHDLHKRGWALVKGAVPKQRALTYAEKGEEWLEGFKLGYKRDDPSTWRSTNIPRHRYGGLFDHFSFAHAQFVWDCKSEPNVRQIFATIWGTDKLTVSFDGGTLAFPTPDEPDHGRAPWPHSDQSAYRPHPHCIQGLLNLLPNGPEDGGLAVMDGSAPLFEQYFKEHTPHEYLQPEGGWIKRDLFNWDDQTLKWFEERGCRWLKPTMDPGDFILWDSRAVHYGAAPINDNKRMAVYTCYKPIEFLSEEQRQRKVEAFKRGYMTSHDPTDFVLKEHQMAKWNILHPYGPPTVNKTTQQAIGIIPYDS